MRRASAALIAAAFFAVVSAAHAQISAPGLSPDFLSIAVEPSAPSPHEIVTLTVESGSMDLPDATITWTEDGKEIAAGGGLTSVQIQTDGAGSQSVIEADATSGDTSASATLTVIPESVDVLYDAGGYVPPFYRGRALPAPGSTVTLQAIPHLVANGAELAASTLLYTWKQNGRIIASGEGRDEIVIAAPPLYGSTAIEVDVRSSDGAYQASDSAQIPSVDPQPTLYQDHPLFGIEYYDALSSSAPIGESEMTLAAVPYFAPVARLDDPSLQYDWSVNGSPIQSTSTEQNEITLDASGSSNAAALALTITSGSDFLLDARGSWNLTFGSGGYGGASSGMPDSSNPFTKSQ